MGTQEVEEMIIETTAEIIMETKETKEVTNANSHGNRDMGDRGWIRRN